MSTPIDQTFVDENSTQRNVLSITNASAIIQSHSESVIMRAAHSPTSWGMYSDTMHNTSSASSDDSLVNLVQSNSVSLFDWPISYRVNAESTSEIVQNPYRAAARNAVLTVMAGSDSACDFQLVWEVPTHVMFRHAVSFLLTNCNRLIEQGMAHEVVNYDMRSADILYLSEHYKISWIADDRAIMVEAEGQRHTGVLIRLSLVGIELNPGPIVGQLPSDSDAYNACTGKGAIIFKTCSGVFNKCDICSTHIERVSKGKYRHSLDPQCLPKSHGAQADAESMGLGKPIAGGFNERVDALATIRVPEVVADKENERVAELERRFENLNNVSEQKPGQEDPIPVVENTRISFGPKTLSDAIALGEQPNWSQWGSSLEVVRQLGKAGAHAGISVRSKVEDPFAATMYSVSDGVVHQSHTINVIGKPELVDRRAVHLRGAVMAAGDFHFQNVRIMKRGILHYKNHYSMIAACCLMAVLSIGSYSILREDAPQRPETMMMYALDAAIYMWQHPMSAIVNFLATVLVGPYYIVYGIIMGLLPSWVSVLQYARLVSQANLPTAVTYHIEHALWEATNTNRARASISGLWACGWLVVLAVYMGARKVGSHCHKLGDSLCLVVHVPSVTMAMVADNMGQCREDFVSNLPSVMRRHIGSINIPSEMTAAVAQGCIRMATLLYDQELGFLLPATPVTGVDYSA